MAILGRRPLAFAARAVTAALLAGTGLAAQLPEVVENDIKAAFLYNFAKYVEWPDTAFPAGEFRFCVIADGSFQKSVDQIIAGESVGGRPVTRQAPATPEAARSCNILFVGRGESRRAEQMLTAVKGANVLTVGDGADFLARGAAVTFVRDGDRVRFDVNVTEAQRAGLTISSRLLRVARRVMPSPEPGPGR